MQSPSDTLHPLRIRPEWPGDAGAISKVISAAFARRPYASGKEAQLVDALRAARSLSLSLVATLGEVVVGHVAFSPARPGDASADWVALGPLAVLPAWQGRGVGGALLREGLVRLRSAGVAGCVVLGNPAYYTRFGFAAAPANAPAGVPADHFMAQAFVGKLPQGPIRLHAAFGLPQG